MEQEIIKEKKVKKVKTKAEKKRNAIIAIIIVSVFVSIIALFSIGMSIASAVSLSDTFEIVNKIEKVKYDSAPYMPIIENNKAKADANGNFTFQIPSKDSLNDRPFKVLQLTDIHIGAGAFSYKNDRRAIQAVSDIIRDAQPDLVVVTGDIAFPVPYIAGTIDNKLEAKLFATLMEKLGVYWAVAFGNHDTESYSLYNRQQISDYYSQDEWTKCIYAPGSSEVDGIGNYTINVKTQDDNKVVHSIFVLDSHSYTDGDVFGMFWKYDNIKDSQVDWYANSLANIKEENDGVMPNSTIYIHIPLLEMRDAYNLYVGNNNQNIEGTVSWVDGAVGETGVVVYSSEYRSNLFSKILEVNSTKGVFFGHDHKNNFALNYKGVIMGYSKSIDYLAYADLNDSTEYRGGRIVEISSQGEIKTHLYNYTVDLSKK